MQKATENISHLQVFRQKKYKNTLFLDIPDIYSILTLKIESWIRMSYLNRFRL